GVQVQPWGPERIDERMNALLARYDTGLPPQQSINTRGLDGPRHSDRRRAGNTSQLNWR
ncbi:MAG: hypothetical protein QOH52_4499, partial [Pseudonocardiales bacterium]|nr:hypothetical protein [Pseudonocardiales bacterium]